MDLRALLRFRPRHKPPMAKSIFVVIRVPASRATTRVAIRIVPEPMNTKEPRPSRGTLVEEIPW
jgi:hypothetical protein